MQGAVSAWQSAAFMSSMTGALNSCMGESTERCKYQCQQHYEGRLLMSWAEQHV